MPEFRYALRSLRSSPGFTLTAVLTLALGIALTTAMYSVVHAVLVRPLPYPEPDRIVAILLEHPTNGLTNASLEVADAMAASGAFEAFTTVNLELGRLIGAGEPEELTGYAVTPEFFRVVAPPRLGRPMRAGAREILISDRLWQRRFNADPGVLGRVIILEPDPYTIVGVMPPLVAALRPDFIKAATVDSADREQHGAGALDLFGRLRPGITIREAQSLAQVVIDQLRQSYPAEYAGMTPRVTPMKTVLTFEVDRILLLLLGAVGFVLLIACTNVSILLMVRGLARRRDFAVLASLGATRGRLLRRQVLEAMLLAIPGAVLGILAAHGVLAGILRLIPEVFPRIDEAGIDGVVSTIAVACACVGTLVASLWPAWSVARVDLVRTIAASGSSAGSGRHGFGLHALIATEVALTTTLLAGAGIAGVSLYKLATVDLGVKTTRFVTARVFPGPRYVQPVRRLALYESIAEHTRALPGVREAVLASMAPLQFASSASVDVSGHGTWSERPNVRFRAVQPEYFALLGISALRGRLLQPSDVRGAPEVVVINEAAMRLFPEGTDPVGRSVAARFGSRRVDLVVVGVARNVREVLWRDPRPEIFVPLAQQPPGMATLLVSTDMPAHAIEASLKRAVWQVDPALPVSHIADFEQALTQQAWGLRFRAALFGLFAAAGVVLAVVGIWAVVAYSVVRRTREIGIRTALGARAAGVLVLLLRQAIAPVAVGVTIGAIGALNLAALLEGYVFGITPTDPRVLGSMAIAMLAASACAAAIPARRATRIDPATTLRAE